MKHPIQRTEMIDGVHRFVENKVVQFMVEKLGEFGFDLNNLHVACCEMDEGDMHQFNQLIGYSVSAAPVSEDIRDIASTKEYAENPERYFEMRFEELREALREPIAELYNKHPDDLKG